MHRVNNVYTYTYILYIYFFKIYIYFIIFFPFFSFFFFFQWTSTLNRTSKRVTCSLYRFQKIKISLFTHISFTTIFFFFLSRFHSRYCSKFPPSRFMYKAEQKRRIRSDSKFSKFSSDSCPKHHLIKYQNQSKRIEFDHSKRHS